ncbi:DUF732 domain-containing protein [Nocardia sp. NPDC050712]|uniref:DUF732 domain-containing protein n=1 Tax=Nocardia sp. NPDC050712 TaxID=3155518 RepID=UPI0033C522EA
MLGKSTAVAALACAAIVASTGWANAGVSPKEEQRFLDAARDWSPSLMWVSDSGLLEIGYAMCEVYAKRGVDVPTLEGMITTAMDGGLSRDQARAVGSSAAVILCTENAHAAMLMPD